MSKFVAFSLGVVTTSAAFVLATQAGFDGPLLSLSAEHASVKERLRELAPVEAQRDQLAVRLDALADRFEVLEARLEALQEARRVVFDHHPPPASDGSGSSGAQGRERLE